MGWVDVGVTSVAFNVAKNLAMDGSPNPAFVTSIILCSGIWAAAYAYLRRSGSGSNLAAGAVFVSSIIVLTLLGACF